MSAALPRLLSCLSALLLSACASLPFPPPSAAWVELGEDGAVIVRTERAGACPVLQVDGAPLPMRLRAAPATLPARPKSAAPAAFPLATCETTLPAGARSAALAGQALPLPKPRIERIVVIGDTGCRLYRPSSTYQDCNDAQAYPFAAVARAAAAFQPDLVIHVGDYHYRESACPADHPGCAGSPWGYGWDAWQADFFQPGAPLLAAAPWVFTRGNHESCARAGQGWWRLLDPRALLPGRDCIDPTQDESGNYGAPYAVPLGEGAQLIVLDTSHAERKPLPAGDPRFARYADDVRAMDALAARAPENIVLMHHPLLGLSAEKTHGQIHLSAVDQNLLHAFTAADARLFPPAVQMVLSGHVHLWQQISFASDDPTQFISGFAGTAEDLVPMPASLPPGITPVPGALPEAFSAWVDGFGFMTLTRLAPGRWSAQVHDRDGRVVNRCSVEGRHSHCERASVTH